MIYLALFICGMVTGGALVGFVAEVAGLLRLMKGARDATHTDARR